MPLAGGQADKAGNIYETNIAITEVLKLLDASDDSYIYFERPDDIKGGMEFEVGNQQEIKYYQAKREENNWTINRLKNEGILENFFKKLSSDNNCMCILYSSSRSDLYELTERAEKSHDLNTFKSSLDNTQSCQTSYSKLKTAYIEFKSIQHEFNEIIIEGELLSILKRIKIYFIDESSLKNNSLYNINKTFNGDKYAIHSFLFEFTQNSYGKKLTKLDIINEIKKHFTFLDLSLNDSLINKIGELNNSFKNKLAQNVFFQQHRIERTEAQKIFNALNKVDSPQIIFLTGEAAVGKSIALLETIEFFENNNWPILSFSIDQLENASNLDDLGNQLYNYPKSPAIAISNISQYKNCILVIDQLDSISFVSGRRTNLWNIVRELLDQSINTKNLKVIISCRKFDIEKDERICDFIKINKKITEEIQIKRLEESTVKEKLEKLGFNIDNLTTKQLSLFSLPINLSLLFYIRSENNDNNLSYISRIELFNKFWDKKQNEIRERNPQFNSNSWYKIIYKLVDYCNRNQTLYAPKTIFDQYKDNLNLLTSANVLIENNNKISFFHETFFDYCFARRFCSNEGNLTEYILKTDQGLFIRAQIRQVLEYQRQNDSFRTQYFSNLKELIEKTNIRFHIKALVLDLIIEFDDIWDEELDIVDCLDKETKEIFLKQGKYSKLFFKKFYKDGTLQNYLLSDNKDEMIKGINLIYSQEEVYYKEISDLLLIAKNNIENLMDQAPYFLRHLSFLYREELVTIIIKKIDEDVFAPKDFDSLLFNFSKCEFLDIKHLFKIYAKCFEKVLEEYKQNNDSNSFNQLKYYEFFKFIEKEPSLFLNYTFELFVSLLNTIKQDDKTNKSNFKLDALYGCRFYKSESEDILDYFEAAFISFAEKKPDEFFGFLDIYKHLEFETIQILFLIGLSGCSIKYSDKVIMFLMDDVRRFDVGYIHCSNYPAMILINKYAKYTSTEVLERLITVILNYKNSYEYEYFKNNLIEIKNNNKLCEDYKYKRIIGNNQAKFLSSVDKDTLKQHPKAFHRLEELKRKFGKDNFYVEPEEIELKSVESPISENVIKKMSDKQLIKVIYAYNDRKWLDNFLQGGPLEISRIIEKMVPKDPERFINLAYKLDPIKTHEYYFNNILYGLKETQVSIDNEKIFELIEYYHTFNNKPFGRFIIWVVESLFKKQICIPKNIIEIINWYALNDPNPKLDDIGDDINSQSINTVRSTAAQLIANFIWKDYSLLDYFKDTINKLTNDHICVRAITSYVSLVIYNKNKDLSLELFKNIIHDTDESIYLSHFVQKYINKTIFWDNNYKLYEPLLLKLLNSDNLKIKEFSAKMLALSSLYFEEAQDKVIFCIDNYIEVKKAIAEIFSKYFYEDKFPPFVQNNLINFFNDNAIEVRRQATRCFYKCEDKFHESKNLITAFLDSKAFLEHSKTLLIGIEDIKIKSEDIELIKLICDQYTKTFDKLSNKHYHYNEKLFKLILEAYTINKTGDLLDSIDEFLKIPSGDLKKEFENYERLLL